MNHAPRKLRRGWGWSSCGTAMAAGAMVLIVFNHPRCFTAVGTDFVPYYLFGIWCLAELMALVAVVLGAIGLFCSRGRTLSPWAGIAMGLCVLAGAIVYPVVFFARGVAKELSKPGFHGMGK